MYQTNKNEVSRKSSQTNIIQKKTQSEVQENQIQKPSYKELQKFKKNKNKNQLFSLIYLANKKKMKYKINERSIF